MSLNTKILQASDLDEILELERGQIRRAEDEIQEPDMSEWHARWRQEALEHYLPLGWSFGLFTEEQKLRAYFIAQPQLYVNGMTQSLWIEHLSFSDPSEAKHLLEVAYRLCREKHFQSLLFNQETWIDHLPGGISVQKWPDHVYHIKTAKF